MSFVTPTSTFEVRPEPEYIRRQLTQFELDKLREHQRRLNFYTDKSNRERQEAYQESTFLSLSVSQIFRNLSQTIISIIDDLLQIDRETQWVDVVLIFIKEDRLIYLGILVVMIALSIYLMDVSS